MWTCKNKTILKNLKTDKDNFTRLFCLKGAYRELKCLKVRLDRTKIFKDFSKSQDPNDEIDSIFFYFELRTRI